MKLEEFYSLRKDFTIIGLTGRVGAGCSKTAELLSADDFVSKLNYQTKSESLIPEEIKFDICYNYLNYKNNWQSFKIVNYKDVLLLHIIFDTKSDKHIENLTNTLVQFGDSNNFETARFSSKEDDELLKNLTNFFEEYRGILSHFIFENQKDSLKESIKDLNREKKAKFIKFYFEEFSEFSKEFHDKLNSYNTSKRSLFNHDIANNLRSQGSTDYNGKPEDGKNIYTIAETINQLIKCWRLSNGNKAKVVIDALKNSLELMYFKEKFSGFYMVAINKDEKEREAYVENKIKKEDDSKLLLTLDSTEYRSDEFSKGTFSSPDIENCIQKSDYHIYHQEGSDINADDRETNLSYQLIKLIALINQPGIITPTALERTMQIAYNAKFNSGCISRQVGAVVTDQDFSIQSIGWNDVAKNQLPCKLRDVRELTNGNRPEIFSDYEKSGSVTDSQTKKSESFKELVKKEVAEAEVTSDTLKGRHCSFCFKSFQNAFEREKNQVHTRSLHAEENAMLQVSKKGGNGLENGKLFTTASPCELCSKKAFQLGVTEIYYIDPYPGIAMNHTLKNGVKHEGRVDPNPTMIMFRGAVGRTFHKLYEPFMSYKDEIAILTDLKPKSKKLSNEELVDQLDIKDTVRDEIQKILNGNSK